MNACSRVFIKYDIPFFIDKTIPVLLNPMIEYIRALFDVVMDDYSVNTMMRYLRSMVFMDGKDEIDKIDRLENYVLKYGIKGRKRWNESFIRKQKDMPEDELEELNALRMKVVENLELFLEEVSIKDSGGSIHIDIRVISAALYRYMERACLQSKMENLSRIFEEQGDAVRAKEYGKIYEEVCDLLDKMVRFLPGETLTLGEYAVLLDAGFAEIRTGVLPKSDDYVQVGDITRTRMHDIKALFFMGVNDGIIPMNSDGGGIISDMDREFLTDNDSGIEMAPTARMKAYTQRLYLYMLVTKPSKYLFVSYSKLDEDGGTLVPSYFVKAIKIMFPEIVTEYPDNSIASKVYNKKTGYELLASSIQDVIKAGEIGDSYRSLFSLYIDDEEYRKKISFMLRGAFSEGVFARKDEISKAVADILYGKELTCSITRLETYARCAYSHFLKYGLNLKERELFSFEAKDMGSILHDALQSYARILKEKELSWIGLEIEERDAIIAEAVQRCIGENDYEALYGSFRTKYMINRVKRIIRRTVGVLTSQLEMGSFVPHDFEFAFSAANDYKSLSICLSDEKKLNLIGRVDRVDICEDNNRVYIKVIDYKSGSKSFDLAAVYKGLDLQLVVYLNAAIEHISREYGEDSEVIPAGLLYYHIDDPVIEVNGTGTLSDEEIDSRIISQLKMEGLVNSDESIYRLLDRGFAGRSSIIPVAVNKDGSFGQGSSVVSTKGFKELTDYVNQKIFEIGCDIMDGNIKIEPHVISDSDKSPCTYCKYAGVCGYRGEGKL